MADQIALLHPAAAFRTWPRPEPGKEVFPIAFGAAPQLPIFLQDPRKTFLQGMADGHIDERAAIAADAVNKVTCIPESLPPQQARHSN